jgi:hypothetical protein
MVLFVQISQEISTGQPKEKNIFYYGRHLEFGCHFIKPKNKF